MDRLSEIYYMDYEKKSGRRPFDVVLMFKILMDYEKKSGRRPFDVVLMFKILVLQSLYNLSDDEMEYQIMDRLSFMRFLSLDLESRIPDAKTIWLFRLNESGFEARNGQIVDATIVCVSMQKIQTPAGQKSAIKTFMDIRIMWKRMSSTKSFEITR